MQIISTKTCKIEFLFHIHSNHMIKKIIGINGSIRKGFNTDLMVQKCLEGAKSVGAEVKLYQISDLKNLKPCQSCLQCKRIDHKFDGKCVVKDDLAPILKEIKDVDAIVIGSPIYWGMVSSAIHPVLERMYFSNYVYNKDKSSVFGKKINVGFIFTMNADKKWCDKMYQPLFNQINFNNQYIFGHSEILPVYNTLQVKDYSKYDMSAFNIEQKYKDSRELWPKELQQAFELGKRLVT